MSVTKPQRAHYYDAERRSAELNEEFMYLVKHPTNPMTNADLKALIAKRPHVYGRFAGFVGKLKD